MKETAKTRLLRLAATVLLAAMLFTACAGGAKSKANQLELGRKYLTEMNYSEAIAAFTEAIRLNPDDIEAYLGRAEAYAAMGEYEKAQADYDTVLEKAGDDPYTQAQAYAGRAGVDEQADQPEDAERDYTAALTQLEKDTDQQNADAVLTLKKDVLAKHAAVCITLALLDKAAEDYDALEQLGENVAAKRKELTDLVKDSTGADTDAENGLTPGTADTADADTSADADTTPADTDTEPEAPAEEQPASGKEEPAASGKEEPSASSKEEPAESKPEEAPASSQQPAQKETFQYFPYITGEVATVTYQAGTTTITAKDSVSWQDGGQKNRNYTYTLSKPVTSVEHPGKASTLFHVPAGTVVTLQGKASGVDVDYTGNVLADGTSEVVLTPYAYNFSELLWGNVHVARELEDNWLLSSAQTGTSMTVKKDRLIYVIADTSEADPVYRYVYRYPTIAFVAD